MIGQASLTFESWCENLVELLGAPQALSELRTSLDLLAELA